VTTFETERVYCWFVVAAAAAEVDGAAVSRHNHRQLPSTAASERCLYKNITSAS